MRLSYEKTKHSKKERKKEVTKWLSNHFNATLHHKDTYYCIQLKPVQFKVE